ncbi:SufD family Fe-S cluster assembly protein, partial [Pontibacterium sp.]|uniref:gamma-glutamylcyclotransferase family protein n=1 Tax=Pontibacterium sp. TaxID=2036026 RepID=UPI003566A8C5
MYYFAYGSNMSLKRLQARVPSAMPLCSATLTRYQLRFHKSGKDLSAVFPRTLVVLEEGASAILIDEYGSAPDAAVNGASPRVIAHAVTEGYVGQNAQLQYVNVQNW